MQSDQIIPFIKLIEKHRLLYDSHHHLYFTVANRNVWEKISMQMNMPVVELKAEWNNLITKYLIVCLSQDYPESRIDWKYKEPMSFIRKYIKIKKKGTFNENPLPEGQLYDVVMESSKKCSGKALNDMSNRVIEALLGLILDDD